MDKFSKKDLAYFRLEQARGCLKASEILMSAGQYKDAANRSYYCIFHTMRAVLALDGYDSKKHSGIISEFRVRYIKTKKFDAVYSDMIKDAFAIRTDSDYEDFYVLSMNDVRLQIDNAKEFLEAVQSYIGATLEGQE